MNQERPGFLHDPRVSVEFTPALQIARKNLDANLLLKTIRGELAEIAVYFILFNSVILGASFASDSAYIESLPHENIAKTIIWLAAGILTLPFWVAIIRKVSIYSHDPKKKNAAL